MSKLSAPANHPTEAKPQVSYAFDLGNNHYHLSLLYTSLSQLAANDSIQLDWQLRSDTELKATATGGMVARLLVDHGEGPQRIAIDLFDRSDLFHEESLAWCDRYLKRSCYTPDTIQHAAPYSDKVAPYGMNYACRSEQADRRVVRSILRQAAARGVRSPITLARQLLGQRNTFRTYHSLPHYKDFEAPPDAPRKDQVLFQTRVWAPEEVGPDDAGEINKQRAETVRALKKEFGPRFVGGLVPTPYAQQHYPELLTNASTRRKDFIELVKTSRVLVYTRGLHHSIAFKMPEYLAASGAIVSDPVRNELPEPLIDGQHLLIAQDVEQTVDSVKRMFEAINLQREMRDSNHACYASSLRPMHLMNLALLGRLSLRRTSATTHEKAGLF